MPRTPIQVLGVDHVQLAMPVGQEDAARHFYTGVLGLSEVEKPAGLIGRGGCWFSVSRLTCISAWRRTSVPLPKHIPPFS